jgi:hypothetical protein
MPPASFSHRSDPQRAAEGTPPVFTRCGLADSLFEHPARDGATFLLKRLNQNQRLKLLGVAALFATPLGIITLYFLWTMLPEQGRWSLMIFCARATRGLRRPSLDARSRRSISPHPYGMSGKSLCYTTVLRPLVGSYFSRWAVFL